jgi:hypothetical protein
MLWKPHGILDEAIVKEIVAFIDVVEERASKPFNRFADLSALDMVDLNFKFVFQSIKPRLRAHHSFEIAHVFMRSRDSALRSCAESGINQFLMKRLLLFFIMSAAFAYGLFASDSLPFPVSVGGQAAKDGTPFAKIENPVAADAELSVQSKDAMIIVNVNAVNAKNEPVPGSTPAVILLQGKTKTNLDKTMDGKKLAAGNYVVSVVSEGKTASILVTIR